MNVDNLLAIYDELIELMIFYNKQGEITYANACAKELLGYDRLIEKSIDDIFPGCFERNLDGIVCTAEPENDILSMMAYRQNKTCFKVDVKIIDNPGLAGSRILMGTDASRMESALKELASVKENSVNLDNIKNEFVANVTHELRTPVNGILGNTKELLSRELEPDDIKLLQLIEHGCDDMNALINNILDFSKLEAGKFQLEPREFKFKDMMEYVKSNHINKVHEKGLDFFMTIAPDIPDVLIGDELRIAQILNNLLSNATKFTTVGKVMLEAVATAKAGNKIELFFMVVDTGIGIDKKDQDKLFKSFSQVEASISRRFGGTGLGLNISKNLVELMGGHISVESEVGKGTMFTFSIWLEVPEQNAITQDYEVAKPLFQEKLGLTDADAASLSFGSGDNVEEIKKRLMKLNLCIDMENWEKAEMFSDAIKTLTDGAPHEIKTAVLKLKMAVAKENTQKSIEAIELLQSQL